MKLSNEVRIGLFVLITIVVFIFGYNFLSGNDFFSRELKLYVQYDRVDGLAISKPVLVNGFRIGHIAQMSLQANGSTLVTLKIDPQYRNIPKNTIASLESSDLLGNKQVVLLLGTSTAMVQPKDTLKTSIKNDFVESARLAQGKVEAILTKIDLFLSSINSGMNREFQRNIHASFASMVHVLNSLDGIIQRINQLIDKNSVYIGNLAANAASISANLQSNSQRINNILSNFHQFSEDITQVNIKQLFYNADKTLADLQSSLAKINTGQGSLGHFIHDDQLYRNLENLSYNLDKLLADIRTNPKRYVHFSVFGGRTKRNRNK